MWWRKFEIKRDKKFWIPASCNRTSVASTHAVSNAFSMSTKATKVWVEARMLRTLTHEPTRASAPQWNPPCDGWSCWLMTGAMRMWIKCSSTLKQHDTDENVSHGRSPITLSGEWSFKHGIQPRTPLEHILVREEEWASNRKMVKRPVFAPCGKDGERNPVRNEQEVV